MTRRLKREAGEDRERRVVIEAIGLVDIRDVLVGPLNAGTSRSLSMPKVWRTETLISGRLIGVSAVPLVLGAEAMGIFRW